MKTQKLEAITQKSIKELAIDAGHRFYIGTEIKTLIANLAERGLKPFAFSKGGHPLEKILGEFGEEARILDYSNFSKEFKPEQVYLIFIEHRSDARGPAAEKLSNLIFKGTPYAKRF